MSETIVHTGQHYDIAMSGSFFEDLGIPDPDFNLEVGSGSHAYQTGRMLEGLEGIITDGKPDVVVIYGDTNSTLAGALAASKLHVPVAHVEAGLRSFNRRMPEEINRVVSDHLSSILFAPTDAAVANLEKEGIGADTIHRIGDVMYDAALLFGEQAGERSTILEDLGLTPNEFVLATVHRAENTDDPHRLSSVFSALKEIAATLDVVVPLHPRTRAMLRQAAIETAASGRLRLIDPVGYLDMIRLEKSARLIATDSGGIQKEAFFHGVPCVTLRDETEWVELVTAGWNRCVSPSGGPRAMAAAIDEWVRDFPRPARPPDLYGTGRAAREIAAVLARGRTD